VSDIRANRDLALMTLERETRADIRAEAADALCDLAFDAPREMRAEFEPAVVRLLADKQEEVRCGGLALATEVLSPDEAKEILIRHLNDKETRVRVEAAGRLADLAIPETRGALAAAMQDEALGVRFEAARGMAALGHPSGLDVLLEALDDVDLRYRAASALAQLGNRTRSPRSSVPSQAGSSLPSTRRNSQAPSPRSVNPKAWRTSSSARRRSGRWIARWLSSSLAQ
jgi:HEAT repeat protein